MDQTKKIFLKKLFLFGLLLIVSRLPFLSHGYGLDGDSWSVALLGKYMHETGIYSTSRLPGYPVHEFLASLFINGGPIALNGLSMIFTVIGVMCFVLTLRLLRFKYVFLAGTALAAIPVLYINSTTTIDYNIALGFILASMYLLMRGNHVSAGIMLGFAIGTRITSGAMLVPFCILLLEGTDMRINFKRLFRFVVPVLVMGFILFIPLIRTYGLDFFTYYDVPYPSIQKVLYKFCFEVWGVVGFIGLVISIGLLFLPNRITNKKFLFPRSVNEKYVIAWLVAIDLYIIAYLKLPMESGYLIPILPFVILIFGKYLYNKAFIFFAITLIVSPLLFSISPIERFDALTPSDLATEFRAGGEHLRLDVLKGPIIAYESRRENAELFTSKLIQSFDTISLPSVIISGRWYNQLVVESGDTTRFNKVTLRAYLSEDEAVYFYAKGYVIYYLPRQEFYNKIMKNVDLEIYKAIPYVLDERY